MKNNNTAAQWIKPLIWLSVLFIGFFAEINQSYGYGWLDVHRFRHGWVLARGLVLENDSPIYVEYDDKGKVVGGLHKLASDLPGSTVISADYINATHDILTANQQKYAYNLKVMSVADYYSTALKNGLNEPVEKVQIDSSYYKTVVIRDTKTLVSKFQPHVVMLARFNLNRIGRQGSTKSVLIDNEGIQVYASKHNISFKSAFFEGADGEQALPPTFKNLRDVKTYAPFQNAIVEVLAPYGGVAVADENGRWTSNYSLIPCPMFFFEYNTPAYFKYYYSTYNPRSRVGFDYQYKPGYDACIGYDAIQPTDLVGLMVKIAIIGILASVASPAHPPNNFYVDTTIATGGAYLQSMEQTVSIGGETQYVYNAPDLEPIQNPQYDFDGDSIIEKSLLGNLDSEGKFVCIEDKSKANYYGVYLSTKYKTPPVADCKDDQAELIQPDVVRVVDIAADITHQGLVSEISTSDLQDTDIFVFRESTGMLITQRKGVDLRDGVSHYGTEDNTFMYGIVMRGPSAVAFGVLDERGEAGFESYQTRSNMNPALHRRDADHLRPNEKIRMVLINRKTGYIGTELKGYSDVGKWDNVKDIMSRITMRPPNLSITAERFYTADEMSSKPGDKKNIISYEGSASSKDEMIVLTTEWLDHDGTPLPKGLEDYGYTGRLAKVGGANTLVTAGGMMANFAIIPGRNIVQIKLPGDGNTNEHFYVNVSGAPISENPSFADIGAASSGPLAHRSKNYVPFKVPVFDEIQTTLSTLLYKKAKKDGLANNLDAPKPIYHYLYRPEYQFSTYQLNLKKLSRHTNGGDVIHLQGKKRPLIGSSDSMVKLMYDLIASQHEALEFLGQGQELVFALGADEIKATIGEDGQIIFDRLDHIASLDVEDFVTLSLYNNTDPSNVLWDYAFEAVALDTRWAGYENIGEDGTIYVSADNPIVPLQSLVVGYANRENKSPLRLKWGQKGSGTFDNHNTDYAQNGVLSADIKLLPITGSRSTPFVYFAGEDENKVEMDSIEVIPGKPAAITLTHTGEAFVEGVEGIEVKLTAVDQHHNLVADGTFVTFSLDGNGVLANVSNSTINGIASVVIKGSSLPDPELKFKVKVGDVIKELNFEVKPLEVLIEDYPLNMESNQTYPVTALVRKPGGGVVEGVSVTFETSGGAFKRGEIKTNSQGVATTTLHTGFYDLKQVTLSARVGLVEGVVVEGDIKAQPITSPALQQQTLNNFNLPKTKFASLQKQSVLSMHSSTQPSNSFADSKDVMVIGDKIQNGSISHTRSDGAVIDLPYETSAKLTLNGAENTQQYITLGTIAEPNLQPIASYLMNQLDGDLVEDFNQLHNGVANFVELANEHPTQVGTSYRFKKQAELNPSGSWLPSQIKIAANERFKPRESVGFRLDVKPLEYGATLFDFEGGVQSLTLNDNGTVTYQIFTKEGKQQITSSDVLALRQWNTIAARYLNGKLILEVAGVVSEVEAQGDLTYSVTERGLTLGQGLEGYLSSVKFYDYSSAPLLTFSDGSVSQTASFAAGQTQKMVSVVSHGQLNQQGEKASFYRVGINVDGRQYMASVLSAEWFEQIAAVMLELKKPPGYPAFAVNGYQAYPAFPLISSAHAFWDFSWSDAWSFTKTIVGAIIPYEAMGVVADQLVYLAQGDNRFDPAELALSSIEVLTIIPIAKPLLVVVKPLQALLKSIKFVNPKFIKAFGGVIGRLTDYALKGDFDKLTTVLPFLLIAGEMAIDDEARKGLMIIIESITSDDDLFAWIDYLRLPADGWEGDGEPPEVDLGQTASVTPHYFSPLNAVMGVAYANKNKKRRIKGDFGKSIKKMADDLGYNFEAKSLMTVIKTTLKGLKNTNIPEIRKLVTNPKFLVTGVGMGINTAVNNFQTFLKGNSSARIKPQIMIGVVWYLEKSMSEASLGTKDSILQSRIRGIYGNAFTSVFSKGTDLTAQAHGGMYHLAKVAQYHFQSQASSNFPKIKAVEAVRTVEFYTSKAHSNEKRIGDHVRKVDIVLALDVSSKAETWVELKSLSNRKTFQKWKYAESGGGGSVGKEIVVDRAANVRAPDNKEDVWYFAEFGNTNKALYLSQVDIRWRFQVFNVKPTTKRKVTHQWSYSPAQFKKRIEELDKLSDDNAIKTTLKLDKLKFSGASSIAKMDNISTWFLDSGKDIMDSLQN
ncbi:hypothetical protein ORJ66_06105 [Pseudoalteromonas tunicata]|uniref:hypothetical protein n=1 Tax=Pseudoalteromonas tunicata TaxID=314281 RepID=UPI00273D09F5|nr:hypothetical protein [Pseudoalteromonas tunicata]MDP5212612.1 hypothetical protein [Pseudoalteromonas tunicata]